MSTIKGQILISFILIIEIMVYINYSEKLEKKLLLAKYFQKMLRQNVANAFLPLDTAALENYCNNESLVRSCSVSVAKCNYESV
jgi:hypothetical protein